MGTPTRTPRDLTVDRLDASGSDIRVLLLHDARLGTAAGDEVRAPHRHDYHELFWIRAGDGVHYIDGEESPLRAGTVTLVRHGQVHTLTCAEGIDGAVVRFRATMLAPESLTRSSPTWLLHDTHVRDIEVPAGARDAIDGTIRTLAAEIARPPDESSLPIQRHLLSTLLLWVQRWYDAAGAERPRANDPEARLARDFANLLERDFARRHDAVHYADALGVTQAALTRAVSASTGRTTKELITQRIMLEASRLLRFTDLTVGEIAFRTGYRDQLYFSRAFRRATGDSPSAYRESARAVVGEP